MMIRLALMLILALIVLAAIFLSFYDNVPTRGWWWLAWASAAWLVIRYVPRIWISTLE